MKPKRGCGCLVLVLALVNLIFCLSIILGMIQGETETAATTGTTVWVSLLSLAVFASNVAICVIYALPALRSGRPAPQEEGEGEDSGTEDAEGEGGDDQS